VAEWAADPAGYDSVAAAHRAYATVVGADDGLRALVEACSAWPPSAPRWPSLAAAVEAGRWEEAEALLGRLAATHAGDSVPADLVEQLRPWVAAARAAGSAGARACRVLARIADDDTSADDALVDDAAKDDAAPALLAARRELEAEYADVARAAVLSLIDAALDRLGASHPHARGEGALISVLSGTNPAPGDRELVEFLAGSGMRAHLGSHPDADLHIVTRSAPPEAARAAADRPVPLLGWGHLVTLGLATSESVPLALDRIHIPDTGHHAAAGLVGEVVVYRGRSKLTVVDPPHSATVIARDPESGRAVIAVTPAGSPLADGTAAPASRATFFLATDGFAPWLVTPEARSLLLATIQELLTPTIVSSPDPAADDVPAE
jgi:hypothetical protein